MWLRKRIIVRNPLSIQVVRHSTKLHRLERHQERCKEKPVWLCPIRLASTGYALRVQAPQHPNGCQGLATATHMSRTAFDERVETLVTCYKENC
jgi:hypothetical protein